MLVGVASAGASDYPYSLRCIPGGQGSFDTLRPKLKILLGHQPYSPILMTVNPLTVEYFADNEKKRNEIFRQNERDKPSCSGCSLRPRCHNKCGCLNM